MKKILLTALILFSGTAYSNVSHTAGWTAEATIESIEAFDKGVEIKIKIVGDTSNRVCSAYDGNADERHAVFLNTEQYKTAISSALTAFAAQQTVMLRCTSVDTNASGSGWTTATRIKLLK